jgi:hypothetical protein
MANPNTMTTQYTFNIQTQGDPKSVKNDGRKMGKGRGANYNKNIHDINFTSVAKLGLGLRQIKMANEVVGAYTNNRLRQRKGEVALTMAQYGVGLAVAGPIGIAYALGDIGYRSLNNSIKINIENNKARLKREISGIAAREMSRSRGSKI